MNENILKEIVKNSSDEVIIVFLVLQAIIIMIKLLFDPVRGLRKELHEIGPKLIETVGEIKGKIDLIANYTTR